MPCVPKITQNRSLIALGLSSSKRSLVIMMTFLTVLFPLLVMPTPVAEAVSPGVTEYPLSASSSPLGITAGPDGALWFTELNSNKVGRITTLGAITEYDLPMPASHPGNIVPGPDGALWFTENGGPKIGRITTSGSITEYPVSGNRFGPLDITVGPDGALWFTDSYQIGRITTAGVVTEFPIPTLAGFDQPSTSWGIAAGPDGALWFTAHNPDIIGRITTSGAFSIYQSVVDGSTPDYITTGPDGALWFTEINGNNIGRITTSGELTEYPVPWNPAEITTGPDGALWFTEFGSNTIGRMTIAGGITNTYTVSSSFVDLEKLAFASDGNLWFTEGATSKIGQLNTSPVPVQAINVGGGASGNFAADEDFSGGSIYTSNSPVDTSNIVGEIPPSPQSVYQSVRYGNNFSYTLPGLTPGARYTLRLDFNELYWGTPLAGTGGIGSRVFDVAVNGQAALTNLDVYQAAGGANRALAEQIPVTADANGNVTVAFTAITDNAMVSGLELYEGTLPPPPASPTTSSAQVNSGGGAVDTFIADEDFSGGQTYSTSATVDTSNVNNPAPEAVYQDVRYGNFSYLVPDLSPGTYKVRLHFSEPYWGTSQASGGAGSRVFNVSINGTQVLSNFDVYATAGGANIAVVEEFDLPADAYGNIVIQFKSVIDNAMVSGIEILPQ